MAVDDEVVRRPLMAAFQAAKRELKARWKRGDISWAQFQVLNADVNDQFDIAREARRAELAAADPTAMISPTTIDRDPTGDPAKDEGISVIENPRYRRLVLAGQAATARRAARASRDKHTDVFGSEQGN